MNYYGAKELAASFRTVRKNTITIAEEIPEEQYDYRPTEDSRSVRDLLVHIALGPRFQEQVNLVEKRSSMIGFDFMSFVQELQAESAKPRTKAEIIAMLQDKGEELAAALAGLSEDFLGEMVSMPPGGTVAGRTRFDMLMSVKEHEMHHRGQLMLIERMLGITPHLTREMQARMTAMRAAMEKVAQ